MTQREFIKLYAEVKPELLKSGCLYGRIDAEDILQTTMLELCNGGGYCRVKATQLDVTKFLFCALKLRITRHNSEEQYFQGDLELDSPDLSETETPTTDPYPALDLKLSVDAALAQLSAPIAETVRFVHMDGLTREEAAERLNVPFETVKKRLLRAMPKLRALLVDYK